MPGCLPPLWGFSFFLWIIAIVGTIGFIWRGRTRFVTGTPIVLKRFRINDRPGAGPTVEISGRCSGLISWILNLLRLQPGIDLTVSNSEVSFRSASLGGVIHTYIPLGKVTAAVCGYQRSIWPLGLAFFFAFSSVVSFLSSSFAFLGDQGSVGAALGFFSLVLAGITGLAYFFSKRIWISLETPLCARGVSFKRSLIENVSVDLPQALRAISVINNCILSAQTVKTVSASPGASPRFAKAESAPSSRGVDGRCPNCLTPNPPDVRFCENCGFELPR